MTTKIPIGLRIIASEIKPVNQRQAPVVTYDQLEQWGLSFIAGMLFGGFIVMLLLN